MVAGSIASLKVAVMFAVRLMLLAPATGAVAVTVCGVMLPAAVVNDQVRFEDNALPATSVTPPAPPTTVAV